MSITGEFRGAARPVDLALLLAVPAVLVGVFALPTATKQSLVFSYTSPTIATAYASHFVHLSTEHLLANLASYSLLVPTAYALALVADDRRRFVVVFVAVHVAAPFALSGLNLVVVRPRVGFGYSGVAMGLLALLAFTLFDYTRTTLVRGLDRSDAVGVFIAETALIAAVLSPSLAGVLSVASGRFLVVATATAVAAVALAVTYGVRLARARETVDGPLLRAAAREPGYVELAAVGVVVTLAFPFVAFPPSPAGDGTVLNVYVHLLGFCLVFIAAYLLPAVDEVDPGPALSG